MSAICAKAILMAYQLSQRVWYQKPYILEYQKNPTQLKKEIEHDREVQKVEQEEVSSWYY